MTNQTSTSKAVTISLTFDVLPFGIGGIKPRKKELKKDIESYFIGRPNEHPWGEGANSHLFTKFRDLTIHK